APSISPQMPYPVSRSSARCQGHVSSSGRLDASWDHLSGGDYGAEWADTVGGHGAVWGGMRSIRITDKEKAMFRLQHTQRERLLRCGAVLALLFAVVSAKESVAEQPARHHHTPVSEEIPLLKVGGVYALPVEINAVLTLRFVLDSGATDVQIPADAALTLYR